MPTPTSTYNLPRVTIDIADHGLRIAQKVPGVKLTLIGQIEDPSATLLASDFNVNEPYDVASVNGAVAFYKNADGTDSEVSLMIEQAAAAGAQDIQVVVCATSDYANENARWDALKAAMANIKHTQLDWVYSEKAYADQTGLSGTDADGEARNTYYNLFSNFCYRATAIGNTTRAVVGLKPLLELANDEDWSGSVPTSEPQELFEVPTLAQVLEWPEHVGAVNNASAGLKNHSAETEMVGYVYGSVESQTGVLHPAYTGWAYNDEGALATDFKGEYVDGLRAVTVFGAVARQVLASTRTRAAKKGYTGQISQNTNAACAFAAALTRLRTGETITNKPIQSIVAARYIPASFAKDMLNYRVVTMYTRGNGNFVVSSGITGAHNAANETRSDFVNISTYDITIRAADICKLIGDRYIGKLSSAEQLAAMDMEINEGLMSLQRAGLVESVEAVLIQTRDQAILGQVDVDINIKPYLEIKEINFRISLQK